MPISRTTFSVGLLGVVLGACGAEPMPADVPPPPASSAPVAVAPPAVSSAPPAASSASPPTAEEKAKADAVALAKDRAKFDAEQSAETARWTPELHATVKKAVDATYKDGHAALVAVVAGKHRRPASPERDADRHPVETFDFYKIQPTMTVVELAPGEGWFTELLAPLLAKKGHFYATTTDAKGPPEDRMTFYGQRFASFLARSPEAYGKTNQIVITPATPKLGLDGTADMVVMMRAMHGMVNAGKLDAWLAEVHKALKAKGILAIEQHRAPVGAVAEESAKKGYLPEAWVIEHVEAAGFKLAEKSEINANPKDTKDYADGVWTLPPTYRLGDKDHARYAAIGESDRMTLRFVKVDAPAAH